MTDALAAWIIDALLGLELGPTDHQAGNRFSLQGLTWGAGQDGGREVRIGRLEGGLLRLASGPFTIAIGRIDVQGLVGQVRVQQGRLQLASLQAARAELAGVTVQGPLLLSASTLAELHAALPSGPGAWSLDPLATADGTIRAEIIDAHLRFDADVTVPIRQGQINFNKATVEHVGPDSRMGVSRLGFYVDAPNGRSYLYQFPSAPVAGVQYEKRGALLGPWVTDRGSLQLQAFGESLLRQGPAGAGPGFTAQARLLLDRTAVSGEVQLGDGRITAPGLRAELAGRAEQRNAIRLHSQAVGRGFTAGMRSLLVRQAVLNVFATELGCEEVAAALEVRFFVEDSQLRFALALSHMQLAGLHLRPAGVPAR